MNKLLLMLMATGAGAIGFDAWHGIAKQNWTVTAVVDREWQTATNHLGETQEMVASLRNEIADKQRRLRLATRHGNISPEMLQLLEGDAYIGHPAAWAELRQELGIGWNCSPDYVLVRKQALKQLEYSTLLSSVRASDTANELLALSTSEQASIREALQRAREGQWLNVQRTQPSGDIVAQYTATPPDPAFEQSASNNFTADITAALGPERAALFLPQAWRELSSSLAPTEVETTTIRKTVVNGEPDLICEVKQGDRVISTMPVRYAHYPGGHFLTLFPGGWQELAQREDFELPPSFHKNE